MIVEIPETVIRFNQEERQMLKRIMCMAIAALNRGCKMDEVTPDITRAGIEYGSMARHRDFAECLSDHL